jgi:ferredoxin--NADP+ reductase
MKVAVVGSGPAGYYVAEGLLDQPGGPIEVDVLDRLPTPYGLVRAGVAPDHQSTKSVIRRFAKLHGSPALRFYGNLEVGRDVTIDELRQRYDAVVLATGAATDRRLGIPGETLAGVHGAAEFVGWYNAHPDFVCLHPNLDTRAAVIIGNGNVAIDVARVLAKTPTEMSTSDLAPHAAARIHASPLREFYVIGRRGPLNVGFTAKELGELGELAATETMADPAQMPSPEATAATDPAFGRVLKIIHSYSTVAPHPDRKRIHLEFFARPVRILGTDRVTGVLFERTVVEGGEYHGTGEFFARECGLVVSCIGYRTSPVPGVPYDATHGVHRNVDMLVEPGLYCTGWAARGPSGTIGSNRKEGFALAARIAAQPRVPGKTGRAGLESLTARRRIELVDFAAWQRIDAAEIAAAVPGAPRRKFEYVADMLATARAAAAAT